MDPMRASRVNELAKELVEHGIASSMDEALKQAEHLVKGESNEKIRKVRTPEEINSDSGKTEVDDEMKGQVDNKIKEQIKHIDINSKKIVELQNKTNEIVSEINKIEETLVGILKRMGTSKNQTTQAGQEHNLRDENKSEKGSNANPRTKARPRTGGLKPGDINIEDYFYSGSKNKDK